RRGRAARDPGRRAPRPAAHSNHAARQRLRARAALARDVRAARRGHDDVSAPAARLVGRPVGCRKPVWSHWRSVAMLAAAAFAASCARLDVYDVPAAGDTRVHVVRSGETLYRIAARYGLAAADLARWNGLRDPDRIYVGQSLRLSPPPGTATRGAQTAAQRAPEVAPQPAAAQSRTEQPPPVFAWPTDGRVIMQFG